MALTEVNPTSLNTSSPHQQAITAVIVSQKDFHWLKFDLLLAEKRDYLPNAFQPIKSSFNTVVYYKSIAIHIWNLFLVRDTFTEYWFESQQSALQKTLYLFTIITPTFFFFEK